MYIVEKIADLLDALCLELVIWVRSCGIRVNRSEIRLLIISSVSILLVLIIFKLENIPFTWLGIIAIWDWTIILTIIFMIVFSQPEKRKNQDYRGF